MSAIDFWFEFASTYSYLSAARIEDVARAVGDELFWGNDRLGDALAWARLHAT